MSDILDEELLARQGGQNLDKRCKTIRVYTLMFTLLLATVYLVMDMMEIAGAKKFLLVGLVAISVQSAFCFLFSRPRTWTSGLRTVLTIAATIYLIYLLGFSTTA